MAQTLDKSLDFSQEVTPEPNTPTHKSLALPSAFVFAAAPTAYSDHALPTERIIVADRPAPLVRPRRRLHIGWYEIAVITLVLSCSALCIYRLMWAIQP